MLIDTVRISKIGKDQLVTLKRRTKIPTWNILCRWAFCVSLAERTPPHEHRDDSQYPIEMTWKTFTGEHESVFLALLRDRCHSDGVPLTEENLVRQLQLHLHRGIAYLAANRELRSIEDLVGMAISN